MVDRSQYLGSMKNQTIKYDVYEGDNCITVIPHGKKDDECLKLLRTIEGKDYDDCMRQHYELMGWEPYKSF